jgi:hypothetical protein
MIVKYELILHLTYIFDTPYFNSNFFPKMLGRCFRRLYNNDLIIKHDGERCTTVYCTEFSTLVSTGRHYIAFLVYVLVLYWSLW